MFILIINSSTVLAVNQTEKESNVKALQEMKNEFWKYRDDSDVTQIQLSPMFEIPSISDLNTDQSNNNPEFDKVIGNSLLEKIY